MGRRIIAILFLVGGLLLLLVVLASVFLGGNGEDTAESPDAAQGTQEPGVPGLPGVPDDLFNQEPTEPALVEVAVSLQTVPRGWRMTAGEIATDVRSADSVPANAILDPEAIVGMYARTDIFQGETLTWDKLIDDPTLAGVEEYGPSSLIPEGFVAQAAPMNRLSSVAYGMGKGDTVDILVTFLIAEIDPEFQTLLENSAVLLLEQEAEEEGEEASRSIFIIDPYGRVETLPNGDSTLLIPSEPRRPVQVSFVLQAARVIHVGPWSPTELEVVPTVTPTPDPNATPTPEGATLPTPTPPPPDVVLLAMSPQQQLVLKYGLESGADIDYALRSTGDGQIYNVENVDINYLLQQFGIEIPPDYDFTIRPVVVTVTPAGGQ